MPDLRINAPTLGINSVLSDNMIDDRESADQTQNVDFDNGVVRPPYGFAKLSGDSALNSGEMVLGLNLYNEVSRQQSVVAVVQSKAYVNDIVNDDWNEISGAIFKANANSPVSFASVLHQDALATKYQHLLICDGGQSAIKKWSGKGFTATELADGDGYNETSTEHRALQVCVSQNRAILAGHGYQIRQG